jgi:hypothetical protein
MGHRANFVVVRDGGAKAYEDQWAALGCVYQFASGPMDAVRALEEFQPASELMDWAFAEAGYLLDFDENVAIVFGYPEMGADLEELGDLDGMEGLEELAEKAAGEARSVDQALQESPLEFLKAIAPKWQGWNLIWDDRGVDAFADHLQRRGIQSVKVQPAKDRRDSPKFSWQA